MNYKLHITKIQSVESINNRFLIFIGKLNDINKDLQSDELREMTEKLEKTLCIGHLQSNIHDAITTVSLLLGYEDDRTIELLNIFSEIRKIIDSMNFLYDVRQADEEVKEIEKREENE